MKKIVISIVGLAVITVISALTISYSGAVNVAATQKDSSILHWFLVNTREKSIASRAAGIQVPDLSKMKQIENGFRSYREMCAMCHTPPGRKDSPFTAGMNPPPPDLADEAKELSSAEIFWVTKNGIRMTGMPAWGPTHSDEQLWDIVAFVKTMPDVNKEQYDEYDRRLPPGHDHGEGEGHGHDDAHGDSGHHDAGNTGAHSHSSENDHHKSLDSAPLNEQKDKVHVHSDGSSHVH